MLHLVNAHEVKAGMVFFCRLKAVWSVPEPFKVVCRIMQGAIQVLGLFTSRRPKRCHFHPPIYAMSNCMIRGFYGLKIVDVFLFCFDNFEACQHQCPCTLSMLLFWSIAYLLATRGNDSSFHVAYWIKMIESWDVYTVRRLVTVK